MLGTTSKFQTLFRKYRLKAEFSTLSELGLALAEKGFIYEDSIFSHWQNGTRIPQNRIVLLKLLEIFVDKKAITTLNQANEFLSSAGEGYLTKQESKILRFSSVEHIPPFQIPNQIENFTGREEIIKKITREIASDNILLIHGAAGVGKSALAIRLGYLLKDTFSDGVLWYRLDTSDVMDILLSIAFAYGVDIGHIQDKEIRASTVRSILANKKVLLIFDNAELKNDIGLLLPNSKNCFVIITSRYTNLYIHTRYASISVEAFTIQETLLLFKTILGDYYVRNNKSHILELADKVGFLPLALHIFAKELKNNLFTITELLEEIKKDHVSLQEFSYGDKNLYIVLNLSYELLDVETKRLFLSLAVFDGKDFSIGAVAYINDVSIPETKKMLNNLKNTSLIEQSSKVRYRIHPMIKKFLRTKSDNSSLFLKAAKYYEQFLAKFDKRLLKSYPNIKQESDNVIYIFKRCYELQYWDEVIALWDRLELLLHATNQLNKMRYLYQIVKTQKSGINMLQKILIVYLCFSITYLTVLHFTGLRTSFWNYIWGILIALIPLIGGIMGFFIANSWGLLKSSIGKAVLFLSSGLFSWGIGNIIWVYYNFFKSEQVPYPSLADAGYLPSYFLWTIGMIFLPHAIEGKFGFRRWYSKFIIVLIPVFVLALSYYLVVFIVKNSIGPFSINSPLKLFFDIAYPLGGAIILTTALVVSISFKFFGGKYKLSIYSILLGFCFQYIADFLFSYTTTAGTYYNGAITDLFFIIGLSLLTFGVLGFLHRGK